jgi:hypothetical protein
VKPQLISRFFLNFAPENIKQYDNEKDSSIGCGRHDGYCEWNGAVPRQCKGSAEDV